MNIRSLLLGMGVGGLVLLGVVLVRMSFRPADGPPVHSEGPRSSPSRADDPTPPDGSREAIGVSPEEPGVADGAPGPLEVDGDEDRDRPIGGTERHHYEEFLRLAASDPDAFGRLAGEKLTSGAPLEERVAFLRAAWNVKAAEALPWFSEAFAWGAGSSDPGEDAFRGFVVRHLATHGSGVPEVRDFLREEVFVNDTANDRDRSEAGRALLRTADAAEILTLRSSIAGITDASAAEGALIGLGLNRHEDAVATLTWLSANHPTGRVRRRAEEIAEQRLAGEEIEEEED